MKVKIAHKKQDGEKQNHLPNGFGGRRGAKSVLFICDGLGVRLVLG